MSSVQLVSIPYIFFWNWLSFVCACWVVFYCILEFWILCCEILDRIEILCRRLILFVCLTGSSLGWVQTAGPVSLTVGMSQGQLISRASAVLLWLPICAQPRAEPQPLLWMWTRWFLSRTRDFLSLLGHSPNPTPISQNHCSSPLLILYSTIQQVMPLRQSGRKKKDVIKGACPILATAQGPLFPVPLAWKTKFLLGI